MKTPKICLLLDSSRGRYIPRDFVTEIDLSKFSGIEQEDIEICKDPDSVLYWESWDRITMMAEYVEDGRKFELLQNEDVFLICWDELTEDEKNIFI